MSERPSVDQALAWAVEGVTRADDPPWSFAREPGILAVLSDLRAALADPALREALLFSIRHAYPGEHTLAARRLLDLMVEAPW